MVNCPSCTTPLEPNARFCGVCGYRLQEAKPASAGGGMQPISSGNSGPARADGSGAQRPVPRAAGLGAAGPSKPNPAGASKPNASRTPKPRLTKGDELYLNQTLNNRFKIESKIGEGGFGAVYRGVQLATGRKVALKLLHPEMTKDENLVARFRREGMVLCNLRDAHTITTYDFDQTPDGTLYIAMELLEGKSLHQIFHEEAPLEWKRVFKIITEMCSSLAEAHAQGIVHRDLKPENIYLEIRPGNSEFVKILDFGIAKVMRGDGIDPQSPQLTATGQTLGTLEYMSPEQLMGKQLDGRSDVYALGVVAYEMITGRLPFPEAKGPAGLITAQLKQTPQAPSLANPTKNISPAADRVILKCLEKDKNNRFADVSQLSMALTELMTQVDIPAFAPPQQQQQQPAPPVVAAPQPARRQPPAELIETRRGEMPNLAPPPMPQHQQFSGQSSPSIPMYNPNASLGGQQGYPTPVPSGGGVMQQQMTPQYPSASSIGYQMHPPARQSKTWLWVVLGLLAVGAAAGAVLAVMMK